MRSDYPLDKRVVSPLGKRHQPPKPLTQTASPEWHEAYKTTMKLTKQMIFAGRSVRGGCNAKQLALLGVEWPPKKGWIWKISGTDIPGERYARFLQLTKGGDQNLPRLLQKDLNFKCWDKSPERFANDLYEQNGRDLS